MDFSKIICAIKNSVAEQWNSVEKMAYIPDNGVVCEPTFLQLLFCC
jgi:hypothetical protein